MEKYQEIAKAAFTNFKTADHLTYITMPLVKDNKLLLTILSNLNNALINGMNSILECERFYKRISPLPNNFEIRFDAFKKIAREKYNITEEELNLIRSLKSLIDKHKEAPIEFSRKDKFFIFSETYRFRTLSIEDIKKYLVITKGFLRKITK